MSHRRPEPARSPETAFALLRMAYLQRYDNDAAFCAELEELYSHTVGATPPLDPNWAAYLKRLPGGPTSYTGLPPARPVPSGSVDEDLYLGAVDRLVKKWGLDRLEGSREDAFTSGSTYVNEWCMIRQLYPDSTPASEFSTSTGWGGTPRVLDTAVTLEIAEEWDPERERQRDAQRRLEGLAAKAIRERLEDIAERAERAGLVFADTEPARQRHLDWVFRLATGQTTILGLAEMGDETEEAVTIAVRRMAKRLHIRTDGWFATGRTSRPPR
jgi:hypothetical protein